MAVESEREQREGRERESEERRPTEAFGMSQREDKDVVEGSRASHGRAGSVPSIIQRTDRKKWPTWSLPLMS
jgi:hypothetical protein